MGGVICKVKISLGGYIRTLLSAVLVAMFDIVATVRENGYNYSNCYFYSSCRA